MGAVASMLGYEKQDIHGNPRSCVAQCVDPVGVCIQPAAFGLFNPEDHLGEEAMPEENDAAAPPIVEEVPSTPPPPAAM